MGDLFGILIVVMALSIPLVAIWTKHKKDMVQMEIQANANRGAHDAGRIAELEDRVQVLERIVTDGGYDVATQIEALRDQRRVDELMATPRPKGGI
jgi:IS5 family transposase